MRTRAAVLHEYGAPWSVENIELDSPRAGEVLVRLAAPKGIVIEVGDGVSRFTPGDHAVTSFPDAHLTRDVGAGTLTPHADGLPPSPQTTLRTGRPSIARAAHTC